MPLSWLKVGNSRKKSGKSAQLHQAFLLLDDTRKRNIYLENRLQSMQRACDSTITEANETVEQLHSRLSATESAEAAANGIILNLEVQLEAKNREIEDLIKSKEELEQTARKNTECLESKIAKMSQSCLESEKEASSMIANLETLIKVVQCSAEECKVGGTRKIAEYEDKLKAMETNEAILKRKFLGLKKQQKAMKSSGYRLKLQIATLEHELKLSELTKMHALDQLARLEKQLEKMGQLKASESAHENGQPGHDGPLQGARQSMDREKFQNSGVVLVAAAKRNDLAKIAELARQGVDLDTRDSYGWTVLMLASVNGSFGCVKLLVETGAPVDSKNKDGNTALLLASIKGHLDVVTFLLQSGADVNNVNRNGKTAVLAAADNDHLEIIKVLQTYGANVDSKNPCGNTPLSLASLLGYTADVRFLVEECSANLETVNADGNTPLLEAARCGNIKTVELLLDLGANISAINTCGKSALMLAFENEFIETSKHLLQRGANVNLKDSYGRSLLHWSAVGGRLWKVKLLVNAGADLKATDGKGKTALMLARDDGYTDIARFLVSCDDMHNSKKRIDTLGLAKEGDTESMRLLRTRSSIR